MEFRTEQHAGVTYLVYDIKQNEKIDNLSMGMLVNNHIPGILQTSTFTEDSKKIIKYNISSKVALEKFLSGTLNKAQLLGIFASICATIISAEEYMLEVEQLVMDIDNIYINVSTLEVYMVVIPLEERGDGVDFNTFFKGILFRIKFDTGEDNGYIAKLSNYLNSIENFSLKDFRKFVNALREETETVKARQDTRPVQSSYFNSNFGTAPGIQNSGIQMNPEMQKPAPLPPSSPTLPTKEDKPAKEKKGFFFIKGKEKKEKTPAEKKENAVLPAKGFLIPGKEKPVTLTSMGKKEAAVDTGKSAEKKKEKKSWFPFGKKKKKEENDNIQSQSVSTDNSIGVVPVMISAVPQNAGETTVLTNMPTSAGETTVLGQSPTDYRAYLMRGKGNIRINISNQVFRLGKEKSYVDYCVSDNSAVSRSHADIISENGEFYLVDNNSLNHTFLDGNQISPGIKHKLHDGSKILLADEDFVFHIKG